MITEKETTMAPEAEPPQEAITEALPAHAPEIKNRAVPEPGLTLPAQTELEPDPEPTSAQEISESQPGDVVYVPGFGWLESQGEGTVIYDEMVYENGNKVGNMG